MHLYSMMFGILSGLIVVFCVLVVVSFEQTRYPPGAYRTVLKRINNAIRG